MTSLSDRSYYTPPRLAAALVGLLPENGFKDAVDICCGSWNLLSAVRERWPSVHAMGVDIDPIAGKSTSASSEFRLSDGRLFAMRAAEAGMQFDLVVANPPFGRAKTCVFAGRMSQLGFRLIGRAASKLENEMLIANVMLVRPGGYLLAIVPSSLVEASSQLTMRTCLIKYLTLTHLIRLPEAAFGYREIRCYALMLRRGPHGPAAQSSDVSYMEARLADSQWELRPVSVLPSKQVREGQWAQRPPDATTFSNLTVCRGAITSADFTESGVPVLHSSGQPKVGEPWRATVKHIRTSRALKGLPKVNTGDIIVSRVGKSAGYFCLYPGKPRLMSDCLIALRSARGSDILEHLLRNSIGGRLCHLVKGVSVRYVAEQDLFAWLTTGSY